MGNLTFDGTSLSSFKTVVSGERTFGAPERDVETFYVPGRNGDLIVDNGAYKNRRLVYPAFIYKNTAENVNGLRNFLLLHSSNYYKLSDSYDADHFYMARYSGDVEFEMHNLNRSAHTNLTFDCKPQRFLNSGDEYLSFHQMHGDISYFNNPTQFTTKPLILLTNVTAGTKLHINHKEIVILEAAPTLYIDCESQKAYYNILDRDSWIQCDDFPELILGENQVSFTGGIQLLRIKPRWWEL